MCLWKQNSIVLAVFRDYYIKADCLLAVGHPEGVVLHQNPILLRRIEGFFYIQKLKRAWLLDIKKSQICLWQIGILMRSRAGLYLVYAIACYYTRNIAFHANIQLYRMEYLGITMKYYNQVWSIGWATVGQLDSFFTYHCHRNTS